MTLDWQVKTVVNQLWQDQKLWVFRVFWGKTQEFIGTAVLWLWLQSQKNLLKQK